jgi:predicted ATPase
VVTRTALAPDLIDAVVKRTDGVPLFAEELTRLIVEGDVARVTAAGHYSRLGDWLM